MPRKFALLAEPLPQALVQEQPDALAAIASELDCSQPAQPKKPELPLAGGDRTQVPLLSVV
jgi:hypothetical protein